ncbi:MAG: hypothetical protein P1V51_20445 [Deltaproteobacteria bacterium]|nr:hypothetical protein [Deltaproteobacteria bacterium]
MIILAALAVPFSTHASDHVTSRTGTKVQADAKAADPSRGAAGESAVDPGTGCRTLVDETAAACRDWIERGLDVNCYGKVVAIDVNRAKAAGNLFEVGSSRQWNVEGTCEVKTETLREQRAKADAKMRPAGSAGPKCKLLADELQTRCFDVLGAEQLSPLCKKTMQMLQQAKGDDPEARCAYAAGMLP